ncbi:MAG: DUF1467 family protein [Alphaproteobacteria bacterium]|nr:DUF1467 family protein [Alphaproteobacteria bacterium]
MAWLTWILVYTIAWCLIFFMVLPWGVRTPAEAGVETVPGQAESAPVRPRLGLKAAITSALALLATLGWHGLRATWLD